MKKSELRRLIREEIRNIKKESITYKNRTLYTENSYTDFLSDYGKDIKKSLVIIRKLSSQVQELNDKEANKFWKKLNSKLKIYDKDVMLEIEELFYGNKADVSDMADLALNITNRYGTEMRQVVNALDDAINVARREL